MATPLPLVTVAQVEDALGRPASDVALLTRLIADASAAYRAQVGEQVTRTVGDVATLDSHGADVLLLPHWPVLAVTSVVAAGQTVPVSDIEWSAIGVLKRAGGWPVGYRTVTVTYDHGYEPVPAGVVDAVAAAVAARYDALAPVDGAPPVGGTFTSVDDVLALTPETVLDAAPSTTGARALSTADVVAWIIQAEGRVMASAAGWGSLEPATFRAAARRIAAHLAAATLEGARYPERSGVADTSYAETLRRTAEDELKDLAEQARAAAGGATGWAFGALQPLARTLRWECM